MSKKAERNIARLSLAKELLKKKKPPKISAPDMLAGIESRNRKLLISDLQKGPMYPIPGGSISRAVRKKAKETVGAKTGKFVVCPSKKEIKTKKTRLS